MLCLHTLYTLYLYFFFFLKSYRDFHEDLFPDTDSREASMTADEWFSGSNTPVSNNIVSFCSVTLEFFFTKILSVKL